ncbi:MAG: ribokinase, partial [Armatimonadetes bacterium]|nr:ribokinase [Armatimonadota bacterium]
MAAPRILVVGSANMDLVVRAPRIPVPGETVLGGSFSRVRGGKGANQAVACARLGAETFMLARVGRDAFGDELVAGLEADGVHCDYIARDDAPSGVAFIVVDERGENAIVVAPGANAALVPADVARVPDLSSFDAVLFQLEVPLATIEAALDAARAAGVLTVLDAGPPTALPPEIIAKISVLSPNETEAAAILGEPAGADLGAEEIAARLMGLGAERVVIKLGAEGAVAAWPGGLEHVPAFPVEPVDTTGAGDAFTAALAVSLARGEDLPSATRIACAAGALATTVFGAAP